MMWLSAFLYLLTTTELRPQAAMMDSYQTPPTTSELSEQDKKGLKLAIEQASTGLSEGAAAR